MDLTRRALAHFHTGRVAECDAELLREGYVMRYSDAVLRQDQRVAGGGPAVPAVAAPCVCLEGVLPHPLLRRLQHALRDDAPFWREHDYGPCAPYFSYWHDLAASEGTIMEQTARCVLAALLPSFPQLRDAKHVEWWAHSRAHEAGHQMHWDSDSEGFPTVLNPLVSAVVYLSAGSGGPTCVTPQLLTDSTPAPHGWLVYPPDTEAAVGRIAAFDGRVLHSVVGGAPAHAPADGAKRLSLMFAFWRSVKVRPSLSEDKGACRPLPVGSRRYTFQQELVPEVEASAMRVQTPPRALEPVFVAPVFQACDGRAASVADMPEYERVFQGL